MPGEWLWPARGGGWGRWQGCGLPDHSTHRAQPGTDGVVRRGRVAHGAHEYRPDPWGHAGLGKGKRGAGVGLGVGVGKVVGEGVGQAGGAEGKRGGEEGGVSADVQPLDYALWKLRRLRKLETW